MRGDPDNPGPYVPDSSTLPTETTDPQNPTQTGIQAPNFSVGNYQTPGYTPVNWGNYFGQAGNFLSPYGQRSPAEIAALQKMTSLANTFGGGAQGYQQAMDYFGKIAGGDKSAALAAAAPQMEQAAEVTSGAQKGLAATAGINAGARAAGQADIARQGAAQESGVLMGERPAAAQALGQLGIAGGQIAEQASSDAAKITSAEMQSKEQVAASLAGTMAGVDTQRALGFANLDFQSAVASDTAKMNMYFGQQNLTLEQQKMAEQKSEFDQQFGFMTGPAFAWQKQMFNQNLSAQQQQGKERMFGSLFGGLLSKL